MKGAFSMSQLDVFCSSVGEGMRGKCTFRTRGSSSPDKDGGLKMVQFASSSAD
jgi:hypothetical protein